MPGSRKDTTPPDLSFRIERAEVLWFAAVPTISFKLLVHGPAGAPIRSIALNTQVRIAAGQRPYSPEEQRRLVELFGDASRWAHTVRSLLWAHSVVLVPPFTGGIVVDLPITCTYDFEIVSAKYFSGLDGGEIPLEFLFSGTVFYREPEGTLQIVPIPWEKETSFRMPVSLWQEMMEAYFPRSAWLRLGKDTFDRLYSYKSRHGLPSWDAALDALLHAE